MIDRIRTFLAGKLDPLQEEQVRLGYQNGLSRKQVKEYARVKYSWLQMQEIRLAIENETDPVQRKAMHDPHLCHEELCRMRSALERNEIIRRKKDTAWAGVLAVLVMMTALFLAGAWKGLENRLTLRLSGEILTLKEGEAFDPLLYVTGVSDDAELELPQNVLTDVPGRRVAVYKARRGNEEITRMLEIDITGGD